MEMIIKNSLRWWILGKDRAARTTERHDRAVIKAVIIQIPTACGLKHELTKQTSTERLEAHPESKGATGSASVRTLTMTTTTTETVLGKRKARANSFVLHLSSSSPPPSTSAKPILVNGVLLPHTEKRYACTYHGCQKSYSKPSRLAEHERSHTGDVSNSFQIPIQLSKFSS